MSIIKTHFIATVLLFLCISTSVSAQRTITGSVLDAEKRGLENATVYCWNENGSIVKTATDAEGRFTLKFPDNEPLQYLFAIKSGYALDYIFTDETPGVVERYEYGEAGNPELRKQIDGPFELTLGPPRTVKIRVLDPQGEPLAGIRVSSQKETEGRRIGWESLFHKPNEKQVLFFPKNVPVPELAKTTDSSGWVVFDCYPEWAYEDRIRFTAEDTTQPPRFLPKGMHYRPRTKHPEIVDEVFSVMERAVPISGVIQLPDGTPVADCEITKSFRQRFGKATVSDKQGRFLFYLPPNASFSMNLDTKPVNGEYWTLPEMHELKSGETGIPDMNLTLEKAGRIHGQITAGKNKEPIEGEFMNYWIMKIEDRSKIRNSTHYSGRVEKGNFERILPPGKYSIDVHFQSQSAKTEFDVKENENQTIDLHFAKLEPIERRTVILRTVLDEDGEFAVPKSSLWFWSDYDGSFAFSDKVERFSDENGSYRISATNHPFFVKAVSSDGKFGKLQRVEPDQETVNIVLEPTSTLKLLCVDAEQKPVPEFLLRSYIRREQTTPFGSASMFSDVRKTDEKGEITFTGISGGEWDFMYDIFTRDDPRRDQGNSGMMLPSWKPIPGETEQRTEEVRPNYSGKDEFFQVFFNRYKDGSSNVASPLEQRFPTFLSVARIDGRIPFAFFFSFESPKLKERIDKFFNIVYADEKLCAAYERYTLFGIETNQKHWNPSETPSIVEAQDFARKRKIDPEAIAEPTVCLFDIEGNCLETKPFADFYSVHVDPETKEENVIIDRDVFLRFFK